MIYAFLSEEGIISPVENMVHRSGEFNAWLSGRFIGEINGSALDKSSLYLNPGIQYAKIQGPTPLLTAE
jgi:hypothetical protein